MGYFMINVYVPCSLLVIISFVGFWINREATADRISLGKALLLLNCKYHVRGILQEQFWSSTLSFSSNSTLGLNRLEVFFGNFRNLWKKSRIVQDKCKQKSCPKRTIHTGYKALKKKTDKKSLYNVVGTTTVLTMTFLGIDNRQDLPKVAYSTALDIFVAVSFVFVLTTIIQFAAVHFFTKYGTGEKCRVREINGQ